MPQKKNPVVAEVARTKLAEILGLLTSSVVMAARQPSGYNLDLQQITPKLWQAIDVVEESLKVVSRLILMLNIDVAKAMEACKAPTGVVEVANFLTLQHGIPFRQAHGLAGRISRALYEGRLTQQRLREELAEVNIPVQLTLDDVMRLMEPRRVLEAYKGLGSSNPVEVSLAVKRSLTELEEQKEWLLSEKSRMEKTFMSLQEQP